MVDFLLIPVPVKAFFVPKRNGIFRESKLSLPDTQQKGKQDGEQSQGQGKKQVGGNTPEEIPFQSPQNLNFDLPTSVHLHWFLPYALTGNLVEKQTTSSPVVLSRWLVTRQSPSGVQPWIAESDYIHRIVLPRGWNMSLDEWLKNQRLKSKGSSKNKYLGQLTEHHMNII